MKTLVRAALVAALIGVFFSARPTHAQNCLDLESQLNPNGFHVIYWPTHLRGTQPWLLNQNVPNVEITWIDGALAEGVFLGEAGDAYSFEFQFEQTQTFGTLTEGSYLWNDFANGNLFIVAVCGLPSAETATPTPTPSDTPTPEPTATPTFTPMPGPSPTATPTIAPTSGVVSTLVLSTGTVVEVRRSFSYGELFVGLSVLTLLAWLFFQFIYELALRWIR